MANDKFLSQADTHTQQQTVVTLVASYLKFCANNKGVHLLLFVDIRASDG